MIRTIVAGAGVSALLFTVGCGQAAESIVENATGTDIEVTDDGMTVSGEGGSVTVDGGGDSMTITGDDGSEYSVTSGDASEVPDTVPSDLPLPEGGTLSGVVSQGDGVSSLAYDWTDLTQEGYEAYVASLEAAGYAPQGDEGVMDMGDGAFSGGGSFSNGTTMVTLSAFAEAGVGQIFITIMPATE